MNIRDLRKLLSLEHTLTLLIFPSSPMEHPISLDAISSAPHRGAFVLVQRKNQLWSGRASINLPRPGLNKAPLNDGVIANGREMEDGETVLHWDLAVGHQEADSGEGTSSMDAGLKILCILLEMTKWLLSRQNIVYCNDKTLASIL